MSNSIRTIPDIAVTTTRQPCLPEANAGGQGSVHKWASVSIQNTGGTGNVYVGDSLVTTTRKSAVITPGQSYSISGSAVDPSLIYLVTDTAATASVSGS